ncbi:hypothetical protein TAMA11512_22380 [Selenomonas sp. TAMA-11512]|uniref:flagellar export chaperone FlgN n=1 Tax=Selenomonas sp. TAMA-11512 TaxID=3095337 RepID=UPI0030930754|nr:hypothetical protein TAMA11512_22380 [Selenomonas sp. TAMA-11512]
MDEIIGLLRQEIAIAEELEALLEQENKSLTGTSSGVEAVRFAGEIDGALRRFRKVRTAETACCVKLGVKNLQEVLERTSDRTKTQEVQSLSDALRGILKRAREIGARNRGLVERSMQYTEFNLNVMRQATAEGTYAREAAEASGMKPTVESRMLFDKDI